MNTPNPPDPLDNRLDELLASQPLKPSVDFTERVLAEIEKPASEKDSPDTKHPWLRLVLPIAALLTAAFVIVQLASNESANSDVPVLSTIELQEIFVLEEGLSGLVNLQDADLNNIDLLDALTFLDSDIQS